MALLQEVLPKPHCKDAAWPCPVLLKVASAPTRLSFFTQRAAVKTFRFDPGVEFGAFRGGKPAGGGLAWRLHHAEIVMNCMAISLPPTLGA